MLSRIPNLIIYLVGSLIIALAISWLVARFYGTNVLDTMFWVGLVFAALGTMASVTGNATGKGMDTQSPSIANIDTLRMERLSTNYYSNFKKHMVFCPKVSGLGVISTGIALILIGYLL